MGALTGCGIISGLDGLAVDDASTNDTSTNDSAIADSSAPDASASDSIPPSGSVICGSSTCTAIAQMATRVSIATVTTIARCRACVV